MSDPKSELPENSEWIQTFTGKHFSYHDMRPESVDIIDIAHHLSMLCRYAGASRFFYSVGEHSLWVSHEVPKELALTGLMHDATEAYCVDLPRPLKRMLPEYMAVEQRVWELIATKYGLPVEMPEEVKLADTKLLLAEAAVLFDEAPQWIANYGIAPSERRIVCAPPHVVFNSFMKRFHDLTEGKFAAEEAPRIIVPSPTIH